MSRRRHRAPKSWRSGGGPWPARRRSTGSRAPPAHEQPPATEAAPGPRTQTRRARAVARTHVRALDPQRPIDLDRRTWLRLKRGQVVVEQTLDLHGLTQDEAHRRLPALPRRRAGERRPLRPGRDRQGARDRRHASAHGATMVERGAQPRTGGRLLPGAGAPRRTRARSTCCCAGSGPCTELSASACTGASRRDRPRSSSGG